MKVQSAERSAWCLVVSLFNHGWSALRAVSLLWTGWTDYWLGLRRSALEAVSFLLARIRCCRLLCLGNWDFCSWDRCTWRNNANVETFWSSLSRCNCFGSAFSFWNWATSALSLANSWACCCCLAFLRSFLAFALDLGGGFPPVEEVEEGMVW